MPYEPTSSEQKMIKNFETAKALFNEFEKHFGSKAAHDVFLLQKALTTAGIEPEMITLVLGVLTTKNTQFNEELGRMHQPSVSPATPSDLTTPESYRSRSPAMFEKPQASDITSGIHPQIR